MILLHDTLISEDIIEKEFICNLGACKGACCIEGEFGAPLEREEITRIEKNLDKIRPFLDKRGVAAIEKKGIWEKDTDGDIVTTCLPTGECNFAVRDRNGILSCGIEQSWLQGASSFRKPISCHLYPIRVSRVGDYTALNYHRWDICKPACRLGKTNQVPIYKFLKDPLIRRFGAPWYHELEQLAEEWESSK